MKKILLFILVPFLFWCSCTEKTYNYYLTEEKGSLAGVVEPAESGARVSAWQGKEVAFTYIDSTGYFIITDLPVGTYTIRVEAEGYTTYESKSYTVYGGGTTAAGIVTLRPFPDLISSIYPPDKATGVSIWTSIRITFKQSMNKQSVKDAFSTDPPLEGLLQWRDYEGRYLEFSPAYSLFPGLTYTVTLDTTAQDTAGNHFSEPFSFSFTTIGVGVDGFYPENGQIDVSTGSYISIYFNTIMDKESVEHAFDVDPPTSGWFDWRALRSRYGGGVDRVYFRPDSYLRTNTVYTVTLDTKAQDTSGTPIPEPLSFWFSTQGLNIDRTYPQDGYSDVWTSRDVTIYFNTGMAKPATEDAFSLTPLIQGNFHWNTSSTSLTFHPESGYLAANTAYEVEIETTAADMYGEHLPQSFEFSFTTREIEVSMYPPDNTLGIGTSAGIRVSFTTAMDQSSVMTALKITPDIQGSFHWSSLTRFSLDPDQLLASNTLYSITIDVTAQDIHGVKLAETFSSSFGTDQIRISSTSPQNGATYVDPNASVQIYFNTDMDQASVVDAFKMMDSDSVEVEGGFTWSDLRRFTYDPSSSLALDEEYTVSISTDALDVTGVPMPEEFVLWFKTRP